MKRKGTTLIETAMAIFIVAVVLLTFMQALSVGITGTMQLNRKTSALNLAKSQIEYVKTLDYNASAGDLEDVYWPLISTGGNITDIINYNISGQVTNVSVNQSLQEITVNVSYLPDKYVELTGYKISDGTDIAPEPRGLLVTDVIQNVPTFPQGYGGMCLGSFKGYYHVFTVGTEGPASVSWKFSWLKMADGLIDIGCPIVAIYEGVPNWVKIDYQGEIETDGLIVRNQNGLWLWDVAGMGDLPGPGTGHIMCRTCDDDYEDPSEENPLYYKPHSHQPFFSGAWWSCCLFGGFYCADNSYPCCGYSEDGTPPEEFWSYDNSGDEGTAEDILVTGDLEPGTYTVLFFNGENMKNLDTISASVSYWY